MSQRFTYSTTPSSRLFADIFTFSAKEKDLETGLSYFGSRYYSSDLSIWLSVDPMAVKYPSLSPYVYCANNPVKLVDPNGDSVIIKLGYGMKDADLDIAMSDLQNAAPNLNLRLSGNKLQIGEGGIAKSHYEDQLAKAIKSTEYYSEITLAVLDVDVAGSYYGTDLIDGHYMSYNSVDIYKTRDLEDEWGSVRGCGLMHEITEGIEMGKIAKREGLNHIDKASRKVVEKDIGGEKTIFFDEVGPQYHLYLEGHNKSTPPPGNRKAKPNRFFNP